MENSNSSTVFVFYTINTNTTKDTSWNYNPLPKGWWWVGGGSTQGEGGYLREEQLSGPKESKAAAIVQITKVMTRLKKEGILTKFKVRQSYKPGTGNTKKKGRKSPAESATQFPEGTIKTGQNGHTWIITTDRRGVNRWAHYSATRKRRA